MSAKEQAWYNIISNFTNNFVYDRAKWNAASIGSPTVYVDQHPSGGYYVYANAHYRITITKVSTSQLTLLSEFIDTETSPGGTDESINMTMYNSMGYKKSIDAIISPVPSAFTQTHDLAAP